jgi:Phosphotransferase enzyme family
MAIARAYGVSCGAARLLKDSNNTIVHLAPSPIVAKVGTTAIRREPGRLLACELRIGTHLAHRGAPIAPPTSEIPPGPHNYGALTVTFWCVRPHTLQRRVAHEALAAALHRFHDAFADYRGDLPSFMEVLERAGSVIADRSLTPQLARADRTFLQAIYDRILDETRGARIPGVTPLHGDPHLDGNILATPNGPVFVDFEGACKGPPEWDLTSLPRGVATRYPGADIALVDQLREARSLCVAAWCWMHPDRAPEVQEAAHFHMNGLRHGVGETSSQPGSSRKRRPTRRDAETLN